MKILRYIKFLYEFIKYKKDFKGNRFECSWRDRWPCLNEATGNTGYDGHYVYHTAWAARLLASSPPNRHVDISSSLYFITLVSAFVPIDFYDYRPAAVDLTGLSCKFADLVNLDFEDNSIESLSCMHVVEHVGLGRYGDAVFPKGDIAAMKELCRVLARGGNLFFVVPVGRPRIQFNAHRIYSFEQIREYFANLDLVEFSLITDDDIFIKNAPPDLVSKQAYGCGCFWFRKLH